MPAPTQVVLDASALLAYLHDELGARRVTEAIADGTRISAVNLAEALSTAAIHGASPEELASELAARGLLGGAVAVEPFTVEDAVEVASLRPLTRAIGLSLGDRACLALARRLGARALTTDSVWMHPSIEEHVELIR